MKVISQVQLRKHFVFMKNYLNHEKIELLKLLNVDHFIEEEIFCSFFLCNEETFRYLDTNKNGVMSVYELLMYLQLLREKSPFTKIDDIVNMFLIQDPLRITHSEFGLLVDYFIICVEKLFDIVVEQFMQVEIKNFVDQVYEHSEEQYAKDLVKILENQIEIVELLNLIQMKSTLAMK